MLQFSRTMQIHKFYRQQIYIHQKVGHVCIQTEPDTNSPSFQENCSIIKIISFGSYLKFLPFSWNSQIGKVTPALRRDRALVGINLTWIFAYIAVKLYYLVFSQLSIHTGNKVSHSITGSLSFVMFGLAFLLHLNNICHLEDIACTVNTYCSRIRGQLGAW